MTLHYRTRTLSLISGLALMFFSALTLAESTTYSALTQANQPMFAARLTTPAAPDAGDLLSRTPAATMEYRIVSERLNNRRFFKLIADAIAVNTDARTLAKNATYISRSRAAVAVELEPGDAIVYRFDGQKTVTLSLNGIELASYDAPDFFRMLLSTWMGDVPISSRFKREILGQEKPESDVISWFNNTLPREGRVAAIEATLKPASPEPVPVVAAAATVVAAAPKPAPAPKPVAAPKPTPTAAPKATPKPTVTPKPVATPTPTATQVAKAAVEPKPKASPEAKPAPAAKVAKAAPVKVLSEEEEARLLLLRQEYLKTLNREINTHKHIPQRAFTRRAEGSVRLAISLDSNGKLLKVEVVEPSKHSMFNEQALEAVGNAQPFPPPPSDLESDPFEFETTLYYDLPL
ncbi:TonB family protein [Simiduia agarivorans]|uniref:Protein TonB n=1 Tax=Simiduia agarivorans (strain DSM 21679 / JCM 13881 / BCRC 17597 / SA1) TaxID=1117647 RepID=K4KZU8_SIMAS|nr:TonB family protein [Simiduia agarivorans]AFU99457.1 hypothetical protein M5M_11400 [Simiduia agarivorans SA1 = DSM 21679]